MLKYVRVSRARMYNVLTKHFNFFFTEIRLNAFVIVTYKIAFILKSTEIKLINQDFINISLPKNIESRKT
jgi:hypothetical protein